MTNEKDTDWLRKRLDAIILILLEGSLGSSDSNTRKIGKLLDLGFSNPEVAQITGDKANYVRNVSSRRKKKKTKPMKMTAA